MRIHICYIILFSLLACKPIKNPVKNVAEQFTLITPQNYITAGNAISVQIVNEENYSGPASLHIQTALSSYQIDFLINKVYSSLDISGDYTSDTGITSYSLLVGREIKDHSSLLIKAADIVDPIKVFTGPNSIWVNDIQESMVVALPKDVYGNAAREGDSISIRSRHPDGNEQVEEVKIKNQLAFRKLSSKNKAGKIFAGLESIEAGSKEQRLDAIGLWPTVIKIQVDNYLPYADSRQFYKLSTEVMEDVNGDIVTDGTLINFIAKNGNEISTYKAYSIDGKAHVYMRNPSIASVWKVQASIASDVVKSEEIELEFASNVKEIVYELEADRLTVGPIKSYIGQYVPDGTKVLLNIGRDTLVKEIEDGFVQFPISYKEEYIYLSVGDKKVIFE